jgi:bile acid:Na+ symporter, BASS family
MAIWDVIGNLLLFALVFGMSATVDMASMQTQMRNKNAIFLGFFCQFVMLPLLGFFTVKILNLDPALGITLLVVVCSPGGSYSNWCVERCW